MEISKEMLNTPLINIKDKELLIELVNMPYKKYLTTDYWNSIRQIMHDTIGYQCEMCGIEEYIHIHHFNYGNIGKETFNDLACLCESCHAAIHYTKNPIILNLHSRTEFVKMLKLANKIKKKFSNKQYLQILPLTQRAFWTMKQMSELWEYEAEKIGKWLNPEIKNKLIVKCNISKDDIDYYAVNKFIWYLIELDFPKISEDL